MEELEEPKTSSFYSFLSDEVSDNILGIKHVQSSLVSFLRILESELNEKRRDLFSRRNPLSEQIPDSLNAEIENINKLIDRHNNHTDSLLNSKKPEI